MMLRGNLKQVRIEKNPARLRALESAAGDGEPAAAMALALAGEPAPPAPAEERPDEEAGFTIDIKSFLKPGEKTYTQRCRLFVGNLPTDITEEDFKRLFERYGEPSEVFINRDRGFGFIRLVSARRPGRRLRRATPGPGPGGRVPRAGAGRRDSLRGAVTPTAPWPPPALRAWNRTPRCFSPRLPPRRSPPSAATRWHCCGSGVICPSPPRSGVFHGLALCTISLMRFNTRLCILSSCNLSRERLSSSTHSFCLFYSPKELDQ